MSELGDPAEAECALKAIGLSSALLARGRIRASPDRCETMCVDVSGAPAVQLRTWLSLDDFDLVALMVESTGCRVGSVERQALPLWWTRDGAPLRVWDEQGWLWRQRGELLERREPEGAWPAADVAGVQAYVGDDWVEQGVRLFVAGETVRVAAVHNESVKVPMLLYDGIDLSWDTSWCRVLARAMAAALGCEYDNAT